MFAKNVRINGQYKWIIISDEEEKELKEKHAIDCINLFRVCLSDAASFGTEVVISNISDQIKIALALFDKRCETIFSFMMKEVDEAAANYAQGQKK